MDYQSDYSQKLRDPRWQKKRLTIMERDEFMCQKCFDSKSTLNVHHRWYAFGRDPWEYEDIALVTLCEGCHEAEGAIKDHAHDLVLILKQCGAMCDEFEILCSVFAQVDEMLDEHDWAVITHLIKTTLDDRDRAMHGPRNLWSKALTAFNRWCHTAAEEKLRPTREGADNV